MRESSTAIEISWKDGERDPYWAAYRTALETRNMEIGLFWQRSALLLAVNTAVAVGFFALEDRDTFLVVLLCLFGAVVSGFDADVFITADRRYAAALELVRPWAPVEFAANARIPGAGSAVTAVSDALRATSLR